MENKMTKKKKAMPFKKKMVRLVKRLKRLGKLFVEEVKSLWNKFMSLPKTTRNIIYIWCGVVLVILIIIVAGHSNNEFLNDYKRLEEKMNEVTIDYVQTYQIYSGYDNKLKLDLEVLKEENLISDEDIADKSCEGFSIVYYDDIEAEYRVDSYINCSKYTTEGYSDYK